MPVTSPWRLTGADMCLVRDLQQTSQKPKPVAWKTALIRVLACKVETGVGGINGVESKIWRGVAD